MHRITCPLADPAPLFQHGGARPGESSVLDFSISVNPLGPPPAVARALREFLPRLAAYPDPYSRDLVQASADHHGIDAGQVIAGNGSNELIYLIAQALRPRRVAIVEPTYTEYLRASLLGGAQVDHWPGDPIFEPEPFPPGAAEVVWLCNPNNPTGQLWSRETLQRWIAACPAVVFVVDEAFMPFVADEPARSVVAATQELPNLIVLRSMTKFYALPGLRLGYLVASIALAERLRRFTIPWSVNALAQLAGPLALRDADYAERSRRCCHQEAAWLYAKLRECDRWLEPLPPAANFILVRLKTGLRAEDLAERLAGRGIRIRVASNFVGLDNRYFRVAVRKREENERLVQELSRACPAP